MSARAINLGYPRIGRDRELKRAVEAYWQGKLDREGLERAGRELRATHWRVQQQAGLDVIPCGDFSLYDHVLDTAVLVGAVPERYRSPVGPVDLDTYFAMARGAQRADYDVRAMEMTKWFDTNYHYLVPEFHRGQRFALRGDKPWREFAEAAARGLRTRPVLVGPFTFLRLGKAKDEACDPVADLADALTPVYAAVLRRLAAAGAEEVQLDEPALCYDCSPAELAQLRRIYAGLREAAGGLRLAVHTYFGHVGDAYPVLAELPVDAIGLDFVRGREGNLAQVHRHGLPADKRLVAGVVDGRNVWLNDLDDSLALLRGLEERLGAGRVDVSPSCPLLLVPYSAARETHLDAELRSWLAFADEKLAEVVTLARALRGEADEATFAENRRRLAARRQSHRTHNPAVAERLAALQDSDFRRRSPYAVRRARQAERLRLPLFPTTTIGSFPQTAEVRRARRQFRDGRISEEQYEEFLRGEIRRVVALQEEIGLDVLVHGEFERNDMVEYFGEQLEGFAFTEHGWVQSYGSRCVKPPIIWGTVWRREPMTVRWITYAQSLTDKPVKGMLTGPVTILNWSFVRDDQPRRQTCLEIALAIRDEVADLERAGIRAVQIDEPALREGLPLRRADWQAYLDWAVAAFRLASAGARDETQLHTHMCYSEFGDIIAAIDALDADVLSIENSRSDLELLRVFRTFRYERAIGPGVYDIHSPRVPSVEEILTNLRRTTEVLAPEQVWVNPDCGLKTRGWEETVPSLRHMVAAARAMRAAAVPERG
jgi:5-methyltetrahydropteroyltriglutamate--homocysteine methyltransferase